MSLMLNDGVGDKATEDSARTEELQNRKIEALVKKRTEEAILKMVLTLAVSVLAAYGAMVLVFDMFPSCASNPKILVRHLPAPPSPVLIELNRGEHV